MSASGSHADSARADLEFGIAVVPATEDLDRLRALVRVADEAPLDLVGIQDHPYQHHFLDTWSLSRRCSPTRRGSRCSPTSPTCRCGPPRSWPRPPPRWTC